MRALVGMIGKKRSGKDSVASTLVEEYGFIRRAFADPLKEAALGLDPLIRIEQDETYLLDPGLLGIAGVPPLLRLSAIVEGVGWEAAKEIREVRRTLQNYGLAIRGIDPDFWVRQPFATMEPGLAYVVTDVRFPNEVDAVRDRGGKIIRVARPGLVSTDQHVSETALDDVEPDALIVNDGTLEDLAAKVRDLL